MASTKRPCPPDDTTSEKQPNKHARQALDDSTEPDLTLDVLHQFNEAYGTGLARADFTILCGYLCTLLAWGWSLGGRPMDAFILRHDKYLEQMPVFEEQQCTAPTWSIPAYHQWFLHHEVPQPHASSTLPTILDEQKLRRIGEENPCVYWIAAMTLDYVQASRP